MEKNFAKEAYEHIILGDSEPAVVDLNVDDSIQLERMVRKGEISQRKINLTKKHPPLEHIFIMYPPFEFGESFRGLTEIDWFMEPAKEYYGKWKYIRGDAYEKALQSVGDNDFVMDVLMRTKYFKEDSSGNFEYLETEQFRFDRHPDSCSQIIKQGVRGWVIREAPARFRESDDMVQNALFDELFENEKIMYHIQTCLAFPKIINKERHTIKHKGKLISIENKEKDTNGFWTQLYAISVHGNAFTCSIGKGTKHSHEYEVRGHWRTLKSGNRTWVHPHIRCKGRGERIHHYYHI